MADVPRNDLTRVVLNVLFIGGLIAASFWILRPFIGPTIWAIMIVVPSWGAMLWIQKHAGGRRWVAVTVMSLLLLLVLIVPLSAAIGTIVANVDEIAEWAQRLREFHLPPPPSWLPDWGLGRRRAPSGSRGGWAIPWARSSSRR